MGNRASRGVTKRHVKQASRIAVVLGGAILCALFAIQFVRIIDQNLAMSRTLSSVQSDVAMLRARERQETMDIRRLGTAAGAVPEIHDRLHLVRPNEAIVYIKRTHP